MWVLYSMRTYQRRVHEYLYCPGMNLNCRSTRPCDRDASVVPRVLIGLPQLGPAVAEAGATMAGVERQRLRSSARRPPRRGRAWPRPHWGSEFVCASFARCPHPNSSPNHHHLPFSRLAFQLSPDLRPTAFPLAPSGPQTGITGLLAHILYSSCPHSSSASSSLCLYSSPPS